MKNWKYILLSLIPSALYAQSPNQKQETYVVNIVNVDSVIKASIYYDKMEVTASLNSYYYWYGSNKINYTQGGYEGRLLHGTYSCFYPNNNLKQKGKFKKGIKSKEWISWYDNGTIKEISHWENGLKNGKYKTFDKKGNQLLEANYSKDKLQGKYITYKDGNPVVKKYKNGMEVLEKVKEPKAPKKHPLRTKMKRLFHRKEEKKLNVKNETEPKETKAKGKEEKEPEKKGEKKKDEKPVKEKDKKLTLKSEKKKEEKNLKKPEDNKAKEEPKKASK